eukprot:11071878-Alexandrium_andersonii.AAC.1
MGDRMGPQWMQQAGWRAQYKHCGGGLEVAPAPGQQVNANIAGCQCTAPCKRERQRPASYVVMRRAGSRPPWLPGH